MPGKPIVEKQETSSEMMVLGKKLENPYTVAVMKQAWENIKPKLMASGRVSGDEVEISTSHYYVKFKPKNERELDLLHADTTLYFYAYPLDVEIPEGSSNYRDPEVPEGQPTYQYVSVPHGYDFPNVDYEVLEELFIPEELPAKNGTNAMAKDLGLQEELTDEAMELTGNAEERIPLPVDPVDPGDGGGRGGGGSSGPVGCSYCPQGTMRVWDDRANRYVPLVGLEVKARRWFTTKSAVTDATGKYIIRHDFDRDKNYSLDWDRYQFSVRSGTFGQAGVNGPKTSGWWSVNFGASGSSSVNNTQQYYALIFQAAHDYYYGNRFGLSSPPRNGTWHPQTKIAADISARQNEKPSHAAMYARTGGLLPSIYIRTWGDPSDMVYATTIHELAHAAHWDMDRDAFRSMVVGHGVLGNESKEALIESWANGVEWQFAMERYRNLYKDAGYEYEDHIGNGNFQEQMLARFTTRPNDLIYTSIVVDLIDNDNQRFTRGHGGSVAFPQDRASGYTILQVEQGLRGSASWNMWRDNIRNRHVNGTEGSLNELFANWY